MVPVQPRVHEYTAVHSNLSSLLVWISTLYVEYVESIEYPGTEGTTCSTSQRSLEIEIFKLIYNDPKVHFLDQLFVLIPNMASVFAQDIAFVTR